MTNRDLLKEAIADAKAIKDTAIANAKAALEESFTPHLKSMLAAKINEIDSLYEEDDIIKEVNLDEMADELDEMKEKETEVAEEAMYEVKDEIDEEINLDELLAELELEETEETVTEAKEEEVEVETEEEGKDEEIDLENMSEEDLKNFIESVIEDMVSSGEIETGHEGMEDEAEVEVEDETVEEEINIDEILAELKKEKTKDAKEDETKKIKEELDEAMAAIETLRSELNEINLLNAKLLYTNKIFKAKNLTEAQKIKVLSAFDKATSKKEAQLVYETLVEGLKSVNKAPIKENLGRASKSAGVSVKKPIVESNDMINRFQKLAGII
jgi:chromosome segregation protein